MAPTSVAKSGLSDLQIIGKAIRTVREDRRLSRPAVADAAGVSLRTLQRLEGGEGCGLDHLLAVAAVLGLAVTLGARRILQDTVKRVCALFGVTLPGLRHREVLTPDEARRTAELLGELLRQRDAEGARRWQGTAREGIEALRAKYRRLATPPKERR